MNGSEEQLQQSSFAGCLQREGVCLRRNSIQTVQLNLGKLCNQRCGHCHIDAGPHRTEIMSRETMMLAAEFVHCTEAGTVDITGGAPEMNPNFRWLIQEMTADHRRVIVRSNLTVLLEEGNEDLLEFLSSHHVEIIASLPCYTEENVDKQRGASTFTRSIQALRWLNALGYGQEGSDRTLTLVYNPDGPALPPAQEALEKDYKRILGEQYGIVFNHLLTITNAPIGRFASGLQKKNEYEAYCLLIEKAFNPATLHNVMCKEQISISWDGFLYDCDFNQALGYALGNGHPLRLGDRPASEIVAQLLSREITVGLHCFACTAGAGSSCQGALQRSKVFRNNAQTERE
ncbi:MAG: arsenosugar biosynthesis radical SAM protein ArsS [Acidobacteriaceae bacterium]|nr:arsenosugar biosynthesis radical SAM protein ArsS [Acidobacteriaceae bacterium]